MTGALDTTMRAVAARLTATYGKAYTLKRVTSTYSASTGKTVNTETSYEVNGAPPKAYRIDQIDGTLVEDGDCMVLLAALGLAVVPRTADVLDIDGVGWRIVRVRTVWSGEMAAAYEVQVRR